MFLLSDTRRSNETGRVDFRGSFWIHWNLFSKKLSCTSQTDFFRGGEETVEFAGKLFRIRRSRRQHNTCLASDWAQKFFFAQSQTSVRISHGTGSFRVASQGFSRPVLEHFPFLIFAYYFFSVYIIQDHRKWRYTLFILHWFGLHYVFCYFSISINVVNNCRIRPWN